jgi:hypothetical protein
MVAPRHGRLVSARWKSRMTLPPPPPACPQRYSTPMLLFLSVLHDAAAKNLGYRQAQERHTVFTRKRLLAKASPTHE